MKNTFKHITLLATWTAIFVFGANITVAQTYEDCGNNFAAEYTYEGLLPPPPTTSFTIPLNSDFRTKLNLIAKGEDDLKAGDNVDIVLVMDRSGSMGSVVEGERKITKAKEALKQVVSVFENVDKPENRLALVTYNASVTLDQGLTSNYGLVNTAIDSFSAGGNTNIGGALSVAANHLDNNGNEDSKKFIVVATDGVHNVGTPVQVGISNVGSDVTVYSVGIGDSSYYDEVILRAIAEAGTGEGSYYASSIADLTQTFEDIIKDILTPFRPENIALTFTRRNTDKFTLQDTDPDHTAVPGDDVIWADLGSMSNSGTKDIIIDFLQAGGYGLDLALNRPFVDITYTLFGKNCIEQVPIEIIAIDNLPQCTGSVPLNSQMCPNDDMGLSADVPITLVADCTDSQKCEYVCVAPLVYENGACRLPGKCGTLMDEAWCRSLPSGSFCSQGFLSDGPNASDSLWTWECKGLFGGSSEFCSARRLCPHDWKEALP